MEHMSIHSICLSGPRKSLKARCDILVPGAAQKGLESQCKASLAIDADCCRLTSNDSWSRSAGHHQAGVQTHCT